MPVKSPDHHARHLTSEEEKAEFNRTAPITARGFWDLTDEINRHRPDSERVNDRFKALQEALADKAMEGVDDARRRESSATMRHVVESAIRPEDN